MSYETGMKLFKEGAYSAAAEQFHQVIEADEDNHKAWNALGVTYTKLGEYESADTCYENALTIAPDTPAYQRNQDKNRAKWQPDDDVLSLDEDEPKPKLKEAKNDDSGDRFSNKFGILSKIKGNI